jgi:putative inorganic carbon (hco3(-)) transporter
LATGTLTLGKEKKKRTRATGAYWALLILSALYFGRPEDVIPGLGMIPMAKIAGGLALIGLVMSLMGGKGKREFAPETKYVLALFVWYCITIPFAYWRGGAMNIVMTRLSKGVIVAVLVALVVTELSQLKRLIWVQAAAVGAMTVASVALHRQAGGRLVGALGGVFENPNDLAINIALNWPICVGFFFMARGPKKLIWGAVSLIMLVGVEMTYSRSGFLAIVVAAVLVLWQFAIRERRLYLVLASGIIGVVLLVASGGHYMARIASIVTANDEDPRGEGSREQRKQLLIDSVKTALEHPIFGIGAGNFEATNGTWRVAHNTYTEVAAEAGFPAFILFMLMFYRALYNLKMVRGSPGYQSDPTIRGLTGGLWVSVAAYAVGAMFASTEYSMYPYYLVGYTTALYQIVCVNKNAAEPIRSSLRRSWMNPHGRESSELAGARG